MGKALSGDLRWRVVKAADEGMSTRQAAARFGVSVSSSIRWIARAKIGELSPRPQGRRRALSLDAQLRAKAERTIAALWDTVGSVLDRFTPAECANYFKAAVYEPD